MRINRLGAGIITIEGFLSPDECNAFIARSEEIGFAEAAIKTDDGDILDKGIRNNDRIILDDPELAAHLFARAQPLLPPVLDECPLAGFNERFRYYRYENQQKFAWHQDGTVRIDPNLESFLTFMIYLNDDFEGGSTEFAWERVKPVQGMALVFPHRQRHQGSVVRKGVKYVLRTDVFYTCEDDNIT